jgi:hypothetical protein
VNDNAASASTQLAVSTPEDRAKQALGFESAKAELAQLAAKSQNITTITNKAGYDECHASRMALKNRRVAIQKAGKSAREDAQAYSKAVIATENELVSVIEAEEARLAALQKAWEDAREQERLAAERAEAERIQKQKDALATITGSLSRLFGADVATLELAAKQLQAFDMDQFDDVFRPDADRARADALAAISKARDERAALDQQAAELRRQQEEQAARDAEAAEQRRRDDEAAKVERERLAAEEQAKADAAAQARREQQAKEDAERAARQAEEDRVRAERDEADRVERLRIQTEQDLRQAELDRVAAEQQAQRDADAKAAQEAQEKADQERRDREAAEQAEADAKRAAADAEAARRAALLYVVQMPDGSRWSVPLMVIATHRATHYANEFDGDLERSLAEDTLQLFEADSYEVKDWASNNMNWKDVVHAAQQIEAPGETDYQEGWVNGESYVVNTQEQKA